MYTDLKGLLRLSRKLVQILAAKSLRTLFLAKSTQSVAMIHEQMGVLKM